MDELKKDLRRWVKEKWGPDKGKAGDKTKSGKTPKWRPHKRVSSKTPQTWGEMSQKEKSKAKKLKSKAQKQKKQFSSHKTGKTWNVKKTEEYFNDLLKNSLDLEKFSKDNTEDFLKEEILDFSDQEALEHSTNKWSK